MGSGGGPGDQGVGEGNHSVAGNQSKEERDQSTTDGNQSDLFLLDTKSCVSEPPVSVTSKASHVSVVQANDWISGLREKKTGTRLNYIRNKIMTEELAALVKCIDYFSA